MCVLALVVLARAEALSVAKSMCEPLYCMVSPTSSAPITCSALVSKLPALKANTEAGQSDQLHVDSLLLGRSLQALSLSGNRRGALVGSDYWGCTREAG